MATQEEKQAYVDQMAEKRGYVLDYHKVMAAQDFEVLQAANGLVNAAYLKERRLDRKTKELLFIISLTVMRASKGHIQSHIRVALDLGLSKEEILEAIEITLPEAGVVVFQEEYGGMGLGIAETSVILEEINRSGGNAQPAHAQVYMMGTLLRHGSEEQKREYLPKIASGEIRLQAFGITEPEAGTNTTSLRTIAWRSPEGDRYVLNGRKIYISRVQHSDYMILLARTTPRDQVKRKSEGLSVFLFDLAEATGNGLTVNPRRVMINNETNELVFEDLEIPASALIGEEGMGFRYILDGMNAERILIAAECIGNGCWFIDRA